MIVFCEHPTPLGSLFLCADGAGLCSVSTVPPAGAAARESPVLVAARRQLEEYFAGARTAFQLPLAERGTEFQKQVWAALRAIPYGQTRSYGQIAAAVGRPRAARAVGMACHATPVLIVTPCHRVVGADGGLTGFGAGLPAKRFLLALEGQMPPRP